MGSVEGEKSYVRREAPADNRRRVLDRTEWQHGEPPGYILPDGQPRNEQEIQYDGTPTVTVRLVNGVQQDVPHLYVDKRGGQLRWWVERESIESWQARVRAAKEHGDERYKDVSSDRIPSSIYHGFPNVPSGILQRHPDYAKREWITYHYSLSLTQERRPHSTTFLDSQAQVAHNTHRGEESRYSGVQGGATPLGREGKESLPPYLQERVGLLRGHLRMAREEHGKHFNEAEYVRQQMASELTKAKKEGYGNVKFRYYDSLLTAFDALAYDRYTTDTTKERALTRLAARSKREHVPVNSQISMSLVVLAGGLDLPYTPEQREVVTSPSVLAKLRELGVREDAHLFIGGITLKPRK